MAYPFFLVKLLARTGVARFLPGVQRLTDGGAAFVRYYSDRVLAAPVAALREAAEFHEVHGPDAIDLALGAPRFDLAPSGSTKLPADRRGWPSPQGLPELREAIAATLTAEQHVPTQPAEVLVTAGAAGALQLALDAFINPGDRVVLFDPTSPLYLLALASRRVRVRWLPTWVESGRLRFHLNHLARALRGARLLVVNSPANPTGGVLAAEDLEQIAWWADRRDVLLVADDVYARYRYEGAPASLGALPRARRRTLTLGSVSQGYALAAARVGWLAGCRHLVNPCAVTAAGQGLSVPTLCQQGAGAALRQGPEPFAPLRAAFASRRQYVFERLTALGMKPAWPAGGYFLWLPVQELGLAGRAFASRLLREKNVLVTPGDLFGPSGAGHVRLSYAAEDGRLREGLTRLVDFIRGLQGERLQEVRQAA